MGGVKHTEKQDGRGSVVRPNFSEKWVVYFARYSGGGATKSSTALNTSPTLGAILVALAPHAKCEVASSQSCDCFWAILFEFGMSYFFKNPIP